MAFAELIDEVTGLGYTTLRVSFGDGVADDDGEVKWSGRVARVAISGSPEYRDMGAISCRDPDSVATDSAAVRLALIAAIKAAREDHEGR